MTETLLRRLWRRTSRLTPFAAGLVALSSVMVAQSSTEPFVRGRRIAYLVTQIGWALHQTVDRKECPDGITPTLPVYMKKLAETRQTAPPTFRGTWEFPDKFPDLMPYLEAAGPTAIGLNLDGKVGPEDYTSPEGEPGIDNQLHRVLACFERHREQNPVKYEPDSMYTVYYTKQAFNRFVFEITDLDDLRNDPDVTVTTYRVLDPLVLDGRDKPVPSRTQRVDDTRGAMFVHRLRGTITDGVLTTEPGTLTLPYVKAEGKMFAAIEKVLDGRLRFMLKPDSAEGIIGGYFNVQDWYELNYWGEDLQHASLWKPLHRMADAYPDREGRNTAISGAIYVHLVQTFVLHPNTADTRHKLSRQ